MDQLDNCRTKPTVEGKDVSIGAVGNFYKCILLQNAGEQKYFTYITIDPGVYEIDDLCFPQGTGTMAASRKPWESYECLSLKIGERLRSNVYIASSPQSEKPIVAKFARFYWEIGYYIAETEAYSWIDGHNVSPEFLGPLTEDGWVVGFLIEHVDGRHATISGLPACEVIFKRLHGLGILHSDLNKHNFLVSEMGAILIDFETAKRLDNSEAMKMEMEGLEAQLLDESGSGGVVLEDDT
ncbi:hypothetical protein B0O99DRAFT_602091 [Bisporella sp. PMI_857]|nr:hypothetical protein B0O99DRAFT_602091 [Bisporella sp. PMI_857]